jgi:hypothetical protein
VTSTRPAARRGSGRTDLLLRWAKTLEVAVVEVKIWGRNDYRDVERQVESYWTAETSAGTVVMLSDAEIDDWPEEYRERCLSGVEVRSQDTESSSPVRARLRVTSKTPDDQAVEVDHFLLRLPRDRQRGP